MTNADSSESPSSKLRIITFGVDESALRLMRELLPGVEFRVLPLDIQKLLKTEGERDPDLIFCGRLHANVDLVDVATGVRSVYPDAPMYYVSSVREGFDHKALAKNGFTDSFLLPMDKRALAQLVPDGTLEYADVPLIDLTPETVLEFDTYVHLQLNNKFIRFSSAGRKLDAHRAKRLMDHEVRHLYIAKEQLPAYHRFTAGQLKKIADSSEGTAADRRRRMHKAVRALMAGFLSEDGALQDYKEIVKTYVVDAVPKSESLYQRLLDFTSGSDDVYSHVSNVSSLAVMLGMGLGIGKPEEIALAGLLHDIGLADVPLEVQEKEASQRTERETKVYQEHPLLALKLIRKHQIELSTKVLKIIEQHHERWDAKGYPAELRGDNIFSESQLIAIADEFEYLTQVKPGQARRTARQAMEQILASPAYNPELLRKLEELLSTPESS